MPRIDYLSLGEAINGKYLQGRTTGCGCCSEWFGTNDGPNLEKAKDLVANWIDQLQSDLDRAMLLQVQLAETKPEEWYKEPDYED